MKKNVDYNLFFAVLALIIFGMIMISSVSVYSSFKLTSVMAKNGYIEEAYNHFYVIRNIIHVIIGMIALAVTAKIKYSFFEKNAKYFFGFTLFLLVVVLLMGMSLKGARGWINIPGIPFTIQPTEFLKFTIIIYLAAFFKRYKGVIADFQNGYVPFLAILGAVLLLVGLQPDFGTIMVVVPVSVIMFYYAGANLKHLALTILLGMLFVFGVYSAGDYDKETLQNKNSLGYITKRIDNFLADNKEAIQNKTINYQTEQALIAIGSGGFKGLGFGQSIQKFGYLPEVQGDFIFSVVVEELGFIGGMTLLLFYAYIGYRGFYIATRINDIFPKLVAVGISSRILIQAFINIGVNINIVPLTGITLPFISYGGSSLLGLMISLGVLLNISRYVDKKKQVYKRSRRNMIF